MDLIMRFARRILRSLGIGPRLCLRNGSPDGADGDAEHPGTLGLPPASRFFGRAIALPSSAPGRSPRPEAGPAVRVRPCAASQGPQKQPPTLTRPQSFSAIAMPPQTSSIRVSEGPGSVVGGSCKARGAHLTGSRLFRPNP